MLRLRPLLALPLALVVCFCRLAGSRCDPLDLTCNPLLAAWAYHPCTAVPNFHNFVGTAGNESPRSVLFTSDCGSLLVGTASAALGSLHGIAPLEDKTSGGSSAALLVRTDQFGDVQWSRVFPGGQQSSIQFVVERPQGGILVGGHATGNVGLPQFMAVSGVSPILPFTATNTGYSSGWIGRLDGSGRVLWYTFLNGPATGAEIGLNTAAPIGQAGDFIACGDSTLPVPTIGGLSPLIPHAGGAGTENDILCLRMTDAGELLWFTFLGNAGKQQLFSLTPISSDAVAFSGHTDISLSTMAGKSPKIAFSGAGDWLIGSLSGAGTLQWYSHLGSPAGGTFEAPSSISVQNGTLSLVGSMEGSVASAPGGVVTLGAYSGTGADAVATDWTLDGTLLSLQYFGGGTGSQVATHRARRSDGGSILVGISTGDIPSIVALAPLQPFRGGVDTYVASFGPGGQLEWYTFYGATGNDFPRGFRFHEDSFFLGAVATANPTSPTNLSARHAYSGGEDFWLMHQPIPSPRRYGLTLKLLVLVTSLNLVSLAVVTLLGTYFLRRQGERQTQELNLALTELVGARISGELRFLEVQARAATAADRMAARRFQTQNPGVILLGRAAATGVAPMLTNEAFVTKHKVLTEKLRAPDSALASARAGQTVLFNATERQPVPLLGVAFADGRAPLLLFLDPGNFLSAFGEVTLSTVFVVDAHGTVLAHPDANLMLASTNLSNLPIVRRLMESPLDNAALRYADAEGVMFLGSFKKLPGGVGVVATITQEMAFAEVMRMLWRNLLIALVIVNVGFVLAFFFGRSLTAPLRRLTAATERIRGGDFTVRPAAEGTDEIAELAGAFSGMAEGLTERDRIKSTFGKFVHPTIAEEAMRGELALGGVRRSAAVFFSDIRGFTTLSDRLEPEAVVAILNDYLTRMVACITAKGGVIDKYIGDAILAHWGALLPLDNPVERALDAALAMRSELFRFNEERAARQEASLAMGMGIHYGPVIAGQIGSLERLEYTVIGDTVNVASRLESLTKELNVDVVVSEDAALLVPGKFRLEELPAQTVKGKPLPIAIRALLGRADDPAAARNLEELRSRLGP